MAQYSPAEHSPAAWIDDDLYHFAADGTPPLPETTRQGWVATDGAQIWHAV